MRVRRATVGDSAGLVRIQVDSYRTAYAGIVPASYLDQFTYEEQEGDWRGLLTAETEQVLYVAETDTGEIVGYALGKPGPSEVPPYDGELVALHVHRAYQGRSVGRQLVIRIAQELKQKGSRSLMLWVLEGNWPRRFYEQMGGQLLGATKTSQGATEVAYGWPAIERLCE